MTEPAGTSGHCLVLFAREPVAGSVKTRLAPTLGEEGAFTLYRRLLSRQLALVDGYPGVTRRLWVDGDPGHEDFSDFSGQVLVQAGSDLGERMHRSLVQALSDHDAAVLVGCDCPGIDKAYLEAAFSALAGGADAVFGPAMDGGYVLVGLARPCAGLFQGVYWGSNVVMAQTREKLQAMAMTWTELPPQHDIDEPQDLVFLPAD